MRFLISFVRACPGKNTIMLAAMLLAGLSEGFGLSAMLPMLSTAIGSYSGGEQALASISPAEQIVRESLAFLGLPATLEFLLLVALCAILLKSTLVLLANRQVGYTVAQVATDLRLELLRALIASRWEFHLHQSVGTLANAMGFEGFRASKAFHSAAAMTIAAIQAVVYVGVACLVSWKATLAALVGGLLIFYILKRLVKRARSAGERQTKVLKSMTGHLVDSLKSIKPIKAMALEHLAESVLAKEANKLKRALRKQVISKEFLRAFQEPLRFAFLLGALYAALVFLSLPVATVMVLLFLIARVLIQLGKVQEQYQKMVILESGYWSLKNKIEEAKQDNEEIVGTQKPTLKKEISFDRVSFAYGENWVLQDMSLNFLANQITAIVGPSGSGKTTILDLLIGLLRPQQGEIFIDDLPMSKIDLRRWRQMIGYVPQEMWLLHDTVFNNVTLGDPELNKEDVELALRAAGAWEFVQAMPQGINSTVGERGGKISGGQRQRITIARALVHNPILLILDEATTALDPENEKAICNTLRELRGRLTILAISHQPAVLKVADRAYRLQNGSALPVIGADSSSILNSGESEKNAGLKV